MKYTVLTLFPEITDAFFATSIMAKAIKRGIIEYRAVNIRDFAFDKHKTCDDAPYGGGPGMLMLPEPLGRALEAAGAGKKEYGSRLPGIFAGEEMGYIAQSVDAEPPVENCKVSGGGADQGSAGVCAPFSNQWGSGGETPGRGGSGKAAGFEARGRLPPPRVIYLSPSGRTFDQALARELAAEPELVLLCGRYEGIDQRIIDWYVDDEVSVGDYVLSSGEVAALALIDATYRLVDRVIRPESLAEESFSDGLLEYPQYTRPEIYDTIQVPEVLLSGHHENIRRWRLEKRVEKTLQQRPDLIRRGRELGLFSREIHRIIDRQVAADTEGDEKNERD